LPYRPAKSVFPERPYEDVDDEQKGKRRKCGFEVALKELPSTETHNAHGEEDKKKSCCFTHERDNSQS
jgi:hypothetical protein